MGGTSVVSFSSIVSFSCPHYLHSLLERPENHHMIRWDPAGEHIIVERPEQLALHVLPSIYRQSRFASFSRQLNVPTSPSSSLFLLNETYLLCRSMALCARLTCAMSILPLTTPTQVPGVSHTRFCVNIPQRFFSAPYPQPSLSIRRGRKLQTSCTPSSS